MSSTCDVVRGRWAARGAGRVARAIWWLLALTRTTIFGDSPTTGLGWQKKNWSYPMFIWMFWIKHPKHLQMDCCFSSSSVSLFSIPVATKSWTELLAAFSSSYRNISQHDLSLGMVMCLASWVKPQGLELHSGSNYAPPTSIGSTATEWGILEQKHWKFSP